MKIARAQAIERVTAWYWLIREVGEGSVFRAVHFDMRSLGAQYETGAERQKYIDGMRDEIGAEPNESWCGTAACRLLSGLFKYFAGR